MYDYIRGAREYLTACGIKRAPVYAAIRYQLGLDNMSQVSSYLADKYVGQFNEAVDLLNAFVTPSGNTGSTVPPPEI